MNLTCPCLKSCEDDIPQKKDMEKEDADEEDVEGETKREPVETEDGGQREEEREAGREDLSEEEQQREEDECAYYPECRSSGVSDDSDGEKSLDLTESPRALSQETRNLTASELLLNKSVRAETLNAF